MGSKPTDPNQDPGRSAPDPYAELAEPFMAHYSSLRGLVRQELVSRQVAEHLAPPPARIVDIGGGAGHQAIRLARRGYGVTILDPSQDMLARARRNLELETPEVGARVEVVQSYGEDASSLLGAASFDAVLCHGVLMYLDDPRPLLGDIGNLARSGGMVSLLAKNGAALAMRSALEGRFMEALDALTSDRDVGGLGVSTRGDTIEGLTTALEATGVEVQEWFGIRIFTDHLGSQPPGEDAEAILRVEEAASRRDPYRSVGRLLHVIGRKHEASG